MKKPLKNKNELGTLMSNRVSVKNVNGSMIVSTRKKRRKGKPSEKLSAQRTRFLRAVAYAKRATEREESRALYARGIKKKHQSIYSVAMGDFITPPKVNSIDATFYYGAVGDIINVSATDDFMVIKVKVVITNANGDLIEQGQAEANPTRVDAWEYKAVATNPTRSGTKIKAVAEDTPGNLSEAAITL